ncbi:unnamed protein product [Brugia pahangi]|uniref:Myosin-VI_CBD domain-containing protein n=1 Tax=Brugia pahangi TaxID=6280 RepID=A0A0N4SZA3_BRUPA|nr:unnamed protein product [Brugia pahangi]
MVCDMLISMDNGLIPSSGTTLIMSFLRLGRDDMEMCELSFDATQLTRKKGAEIIAIEFETVWHQCGGSVYHVRLNMK